MLTNLNNIRVETTGNLWFNDKPLDYLKLIEDKLISPYIDPSWTFVVNKAQPDNAEYPEMTQTGFVNSLGWLVGYGLVVNNVTGETFEAEFDENGVPKDKGLDRWISMT